MSAPILSCEGLSIGFRHPRGMRFVLAESLDLRVQGGDFICLLGPNGAGKSTLLRTLGGMHDPLAGRVLLEGRDLHALGARERARSLSLVLTQPVSPGFLTVYSLVALGRYPYTNWLDELSPRDDQVVRAALHSVGAEDLAFRDMGSLSDGERQKVMIARALAQEPRLMLLDEPTAFLDVPRRIELMQLLKRMAHETGRAVLMSTHDLDLALGWADKIWMFKAGGPMLTGAPARLVAQGAFEAVFDTPDVVFDRKRGSFRPR